MKAVGAGKRTAIARGRGEHACEHEQDLAQRSGHGELVASALMERLAASFGRCSLQRLQVELEPEVHAEHNHKQHPAHDGAVGGPNPNECRNLNKPS